MAVVKGEGREIRVRPKLFDVDGLVLDLLVLKEKRYRPRAVASVRGG